MGTSNIADKVVVITGASSGLGESTAKLLARHGELDPILRASKFASAPPLLGLALYIRGAPPPHACLRVLRYPNDALHRRCADVCRVRG
jgi:NAD(P)-dependent dehydrogenase (short-subunit alcohol dehydrogenase family)